MFNKAAIGSTTSAKLFEGERWMVWTGLLGFLLAGICAYWILMNGATVAPNGDVYKAFSFNMAFGMFVLSTAAILPFSAMKQWGRALFRWSYNILALYAYTAENLQNFRGVNPRFVENGTSFDNIVGALFGLVAMLLVVFYVFLAVQYFNIITTRIIYSVKRGTSRSTPFECIDHSGLGENKLPADLHPLLHQSRLAVEVGEE